jgi:hypothetical protein
MLRSHPADATHIQRVAVPTPHNGIPLKRFFTAIAIVLKLHTEVATTRWPSTTPCSLLCRRPTIN